MPVTKHSFDDSRNGDAQANELRPYFFHRDVSDVIGEAFEMLLRKKVSERSGAGSHTGYEREVLREQRLTMFAYDAPMQRMFGGDFEAFSAACDDPRRMHERVRWWLQRSRSASGKRERSQEAERRTWDDEATPSRAWEEAQHQHHHHHANTQEEEGDPVYDAAFRWACRTDRWSRRLNVGGRVHDRDLFRVLVNAPFVAPKIAFAASGAADRDEAGYETAAIGYRLAALFLQRTLESLANCYGKRIGRPQTVHDLMDEGREVLADIESRLAEIESELRHRGGS